jgi:uncharacterized protein
MLKKIGLLSLLIGLFTSVVSYAQDFRKAENTYFKREYVKAFQEFGSLAKQGDLKALTYLARLYDEGQGISQDTKKAEDLRREAFLKATQLADDGDAEAQLILGIMYKSGIATPRDYKEAVTWLHKAAVQGYAEAQFQLVRMYGRGNGVPRDLKEATRWLRKAAKQGHIKAQLDLANLYRSGNKDLGVIKNDKDAEVWFLKAFHNIEPLAEQGYVRAQYDLGELYYNSKGIPKDRKEAVKWYRKAAKQGYFLAQNHLRNMFSYGFGFLDEYEALELYREIADEGIALLQNDLGEIYCYGRGVVHKDMKESAKWHRKAAEQGHRSSQYDLGVFLENGDGVPQNYNEAAKWYRKAAAQGSKYAQSRLGYMYAMGKGVLKDYAYAHMWWNIVASSGDTREKENRDTIEKQMTPAQIAHAQDLARKCVESNFQNCK